MIELLVVIAIIGLLATIILVSLNSARVKARNARRLADAHQLVTAMQLYLSDNGNMMACGGAVSNNPTDWDNGRCLQNALSPYMSKLPLDPLNDVNYYYYVCTEGSGCNASYPDSRYWVQFWLENLGGQTFFVYK